MSTATATITSSCVRLPRQITVQNIRLIWVDASIDPSKEDFQNMLTHLQDAVNDVNCFTQLDEAVDFLTDADNTKASLIVSNTLGQQIVPLIHDVPQLYGIYIFPSSNPKDEQWTEQWVKIKGTYTEIMSIGESVQQAVKQYNKDSIAISFATVDEMNSNQDLNQLEPTFMYTQIFKETLLEMDDRQLSIKDMVLFWRGCYTGNNSKLKDIDEFERDYRPQSSIWWYTREKFIYEMLNRALRLMEGDIIINMGSFLRHLHHQIEELHRKQAHDHRGQPFIVYRGQGLSTRDFQKLLKSKGRLISFNNFLSTSMDEKVSHFFAESSSMQIETIGVLFKMTINPSISSAPFASVQKVSYFQTEEEILFSMHTVFRVGEIIKLDNTDSLYQVDLKLTADDDQDLRILTERIREEVVGETGWIRLGSLLLKLSQFDKATELYNELLEKTTDQDEKAVYYHKLGIIKNHQGDYEKAIEYFQKSPEIREKILPVNHPDLAPSYNNIGMVYMNMGEYSKALSFYEKSFQILEKTLPVNHPSLAISYNNIAALYDSIGEYSKALSFYAKGCGIWEKTLPANHPDLAISYNNIGIVYTNMGEYSKTLLFYEKSLEIREKTLPVNHPDLASSYSNIGMVYMNMGEYSKALSFYEKSFEILEKTLSANHPSLAISYNNIGMVYMKMGEYSKALSFFEKSLEIRQKTLPVNHPDLAISYNNIGMVYMNMGKYSKALSFYEKSLELRQKTLPANHPSLATSYNNIAAVYDSIGEYSKALSFYAKGCGIWEKALPTNHPSLATSYNNIGMVYTNMAEYSKALSFYEKSLEIREKTLPANHPSLATSYNSIAAVYDSIGEYSKALSFYHRALKVLQSSLSSNHPKTKVVQKNIESLKAKM